MLARVRAWAATRRAEHRAVAEYRDAWRRLVRERYTRTPGPTEADGRTAAGPSEAQTNRDNDKR